MAPSHLAGQQDPADFGAVGQVDVCHLALMPEHGAGVYLPALIQELRDLLGVHPFDFLLLHGLFLLRCARFDLKAVLAPVRAPVPEP